MNCEYRNCGKELKPQTGAGRKAHYCNRNCRRMETYYKNKGTNESIVKHSGKGGIYEDLAFGRR